MRTLNTLGLKSTIGGVGVKGQRNQTYKPSYGRVIKVIMSSDDPDWEFYGCDQALYGVVYQKISDVTTGVDVGEGFAYCRDANVRRIPIKGEIVSLISEFNVDLVETSQQHDATKIYWTGIIPIWNSPHLNDYPDQFGEDANKPADTGEYFKETGEVKPLMLCPGDLSLEGRHGQSIRMGGSTSEESQEGISTESGRPYIIVRNGQPNLTNLDSDHKFKGQGPVYAVLEDVNKDSASIYLTSDQQVPLTEAFTKRDAVKGDKVPVLAKGYKGAQIVANADRIFLNAREHDIELSGKEGIGLEARTIYIDGKEYIAFDADKIYLGKASVNVSNDKDNNEPVLKGKTTVEWLSDLCDQLKSLLETMSKPAGGDSKVWISSVIGTAASTIPIVESLKNGLPSLKSRKVYTE